MQEGRQRVDHRRQQDVDALRHSEHQLSVMAGRTLHRIAAVDGTAALTELPMLFFRRLGREDDRGWLDAERGEKAEPELVGRPQVEDARDSDAELRPQLPGA